MAWILMCRRKGERLWVLYHPRRRGPMNALIAAANVVGDADESVPARLLVKRAAMFAASTLPKEREYAIVEVDRGLKQAGRSAAARRALELAVAGGLITGRSLEVGTCAIVSLEDVARWRKAVGRG